MALLLNPDHVTVAVADAEAAISFFELLGFRKSHVAEIDGGEPARYMGMPDMSDEMDYISRRLRFFEGPESITLELVEWVEPN